MIRKKKKYLKPRQIYDSKRIKEENVLVKKYALKNKREIWKALAKVNYFRHRAKALANSPLEEQEVLFRKLNERGLNTRVIADVLGLEVEDILKRRIPTIVVQKGFANTPQQARQMVTHKRVLINGKVVNSPSYLVKVSEENSIMIKNKAKTVVEGKPAEQQSSEVLPEENIEEVVEGGDE